MTGRYIFYISDSTAVPLDWAYIEDGVLFEKGVLENASSLCDFVSSRPAPVVADCVLHGECVALRHLVNPPKSVAKFNAAASYVLEDELAEPVDDLHIVCVTSDDTGRIFAVRDVIIDAWLAVFADAGVDIETLVPDFCLLSGEGADPVLAFDSQHVLGCIEGKGFSAETKIAPYLIEPQFESGKLDSAVVYGDRGRAPWNVEIADADWRALPDDSLFTLLIRADRNNVPVNLLDGKRRSRQSLLHFSNHWRRIAAFVALLAVTCSALFLAGGVRDLRLAKAYEARALQLHQSSFPDITTDAFVHARQILATDEEPEFLNLTASLFTALSQVQNVDVDRLRYDRARGQLVISVRSRDDQRIEILRNELVAGGVSVRDTGGFRRSGNDWIGDLIVGRL